MAVSIPSQGTIVPKTSDKLTYSEESLGHPQKPAFWTSICSLLRMLFAKPGKFPQPHFLISFKYVILPLGLLLGAVVRIK